jgi:diguanylate cyclase (GGDEF)-like protein
MRFFALPNRVDDSAGRRSRTTVLLWATYGLLGTICLGYLASLLIRPNDSYWTWLDGWVVDAVEIVASFLCLARGFGRRRGRGVALFLGASLLAWTLGDIVLTIQSLGGATPPSPSLADASYLCFYPLAYVAVMLFLRTKVKRLSVSSWLDGAVAGLGAAAVCSAFVFHDLVHLTGSNPFAAVVDLAYPVGDLLLLGLLVGATAVLAGGRKAPWALLAVGIGVNVVGDGFNLLNQSLGALKAGNILISLAWVVSIILMSMSVWLRPGDANPLAPHKEAGFVLPQIAAACSLGILFTGAFVHLNRVAVALATATLIVVGVRLALSVHGMRFLSQERHRLSITDDLTGLGNRRHLFGILNEFFTDYRNPAVRQRGLAFLFLDLDDFKEVNDSFGHPSGDELLRQLGPRLQGSLRSCDLLVRLGGDEFAVMLVDADVEYATTVAERLTAALVDPFVLGAVSAPISASIGIAIAPTNGFDSAGLMWCADVAMYRAKAAGAAFAIYDHSVDGAESRLRSVEELRAAIEGDLRLHYQPQLDLRTGEITAVEALLRWAHPTLGLLAPDRFLPLAEEGGLMRSVTTFVLEEALAQCAAWRSAGHRLVMSVNVSATNLLDPGLIEEIRTLLGRYGLPSDVLVVEVTETCIISEFERSQRVIKELRDLGVVVSIDDFGSGFTSLAYLSSLAVGELKLDRIFLAGLATEEKERDTELVRATIDLAHAMGLRVVAEGVEDESTLDLLARFGCDIAQGYFISRPKPGGDLLPWLEARLAAEAPDLCPIEALPINDRRGLAVPRRG